MIAFLVIKLLFGEEKDDLELLCDSKLINFFFLFIKIKIICIGTVISMNDLLSTLTASLCIRYLSNNL